MKIFILMLVFIGFMFGSVDINKANEKELTVLHGIGVKKAEKIVVYRQENGCFNTIEDLSKVKGIGPKTIEKNRKDIILSECK